MDDSALPPEVSSPPPAAGGQLLRLRPAWSGTLLTLAPAWAALAGMLAAGPAWSWALLLRLLSLALLSEALYETLVGCAEEAGEGENRRGPAPARLAWLPYSAPDSPSGGLARWWAKTTGGRFGGVVATLLLAGVLAAWVGWPAPMAALALLALGALRPALGRLWAGLGRWTQAGAAVFIPWLTAGALAGGVREASLLCALLYTLARGALLDGGRPARSLWALLLANLAQLAVLGVLIALKRPLAAAGFAVLLAAQGLAQALGRRSSDEAAWGRVQPLALAGMLLASWVVGQ